MDHKIRASLHELEQRDDRAGVLAFGKARDSLFPDFRGCIVEPLIERFAKFWVVSVGLIPDTESGPIAYLGIRIGCEGYKSFNGCRILRKVTERTGDRESYLVTWMICERYKEWDGGLFVEMSQPKQRRFECLLVGFGGNQTGKDFE